MPTMPDTPREMEPPSNCTDNCQKAAYVAWSAWAC